MSRKLFALFMLLVGGVDPVFGQTNDIFPKSNLSNGSSAMAGDTNSSISNLGSPWPAIDAVGRKLPMYEEVGPPVAERFVGIFYFLTHGGEEKSSQFGGGPYDVSKILTKDPDALQQPDSPLWGSIGTGHYWGEPLFGYYDSMDPWVIQRHARMLSDAGVDTLIFDTTNAKTYRRTYLALCETFRQLRSMGENTPQIAFMVNTRAGETAQRIYEDLYKPGLYQELWFRWKGKPLLICDPEAASSEVKQFFSLRRAHWPFTLTNTPYAWHWESTYPQCYGYAEAPNDPEEVNVSVAQNLRQSDGQVVNMSEGQARGRSFHEGKEDSHPGSVNNGYNFAEQWQRAFDLKPPFVMITGWNEWTAGRWGKPGGPIIFVDQFNEEFSRDIEPMKGGHGDNYYWQMVANIRRFKGMRPLPKASAPKSIDIAGDFSQWNEVRPAFHDHLDDIKRRDFNGAAGLHYTNGTGRNDLELLKVARDEKNLFFYARTRAPLTPCTDSDWMWLLIDTDQNSKTGWEGYDFIVNRRVESSGKTWLERNTGGWNWQKVALLDFQVRGNELQLAIPRSALGLGHGAAASFDFKWADNISAPGDIMDFYLSGDVAPDARFSYRYLAE